MIRTVSRTPSMSGTSKAATRTNSSARLGQSGRQGPGLESKKSTEKTPDKELTGQVEPESSSGSGPPSLERKTSERSERRVSSSPAKVGPAERRMSDKVESLKKVSNKFIVKTEF